VKPLRRLVARFKALCPEAPVIAFPRCAATHLGRFADVEGLAGLGLDTAADPKVAASLLTGRLALQGNLDPLALIAGGAALDAAVDAALEGFAPRAHIFNLGHGILPETPIAHVERMLARLRG
jgi:uroporphyrinogen decarboxylase